MKIAIEATGGDNGFQEIANGAKKALDKDSSLELILVAGKDKLPDKYDLDDRIRIVTAQYTSCINDRNNRTKSSIYKLLEIHKRGEVSAVIVPGDTAATVVYSLNVLKKIPGVLRPAIPTHWPFNNVLIDSGANACCIPENLLQFAIFGKIYSENYLKVNDPFIGVLSNGIEDYKGNILAKQSKGLIDKLEEKGYNVSRTYFEGTCFADLTKGQVVVTDGHTGNIALKTAEVALKTVFDKIKEKISKRNYLMKVFAYLAIRSPSNKLKQEFDYRSYATAPLLGVNGNIMICHGRSDSETITNAIFKTQKYLESNINMKLEEELRKISE